MIETIDDFARSLNDSGQTDVIALDFSKAFDKVPHQRLIYKLHHYGIHGHLLTWIKQFLTNRTQCVMLDGQESFFTMVSSGIPQGTVLAPLLFLCYINDLSDQVVLRVRLYADDVLLYSPVNSDCDYYNLQNHINSLLKWTQDWQMEFNPKKCEFLRITKKKQVTQFTYYIGSCPIQEVPFIKYLGVSIDNQLTWNEHIKRITSKAISVKSFLQRNLSSCPIKVKINCYKSLVRPILEYASIVWSPHTQLNINKVEKIQRQAARFIKNNFSWHSSVSNMLQIT